MTRSSLDRQALSSFCAGLSALCSVVLLLLPAGVSAQSQSISPAADRWEAEGGVLVASGFHHFSDGWNCDGSTQLWWRWGEDPKKVRASHTAEEVAADVDVIKGQFTIQGPGYLGLVEKQRGKAETYLKTPESRQVWRAGSLWIQFMERKPVVVGKQLEWSGEWKTRSNLRSIPEHLTSLRWVPPGDPLTVDIHASNRGWQGRRYFPDVLVEYEYWFFPRAGGKVIPDLLTWGETF